MTTKTATATILRRNNETQEWGRQEATDLDSNRLRFNWGYHDGAFFVNHGMTRRPDDLTVATIEARHFDPIYAKAWVRGYADAKARAYHASSEPAWIASGIKDGYEDHRRM